MSSSLAKWTETTNQTILLLLFRFAFRVVTYSAVSTVGRIAIRNRGRKKQRSRYPLWEGYKTSGKKINGCMYDPPKLPTRPPFHLSPSISSSCFLALCFAKRVGTPSGISYYVVPADPA